MATHATLVYHPDCSTVANPSVFEVKNSNLQRLTLPIVVTGFSSLRWTYVIEEGVPDERQCHVSLNANRQRDAF